MTYQVKIHPKVERFLNKCEKTISERIRKRLMLLKKEPFRYLEHYEGEDYYKFRIGDYRALVDIDISRKIVLVRVLDHRDKIYKKVQSRRWL